MNPQAQSSKAEPVFTAAVSSSEDVHVTVQNAYGDPQGGKPHVVVLHVAYRDHGITLWPREAGHLAELLIRAAVAAGDPTAKRVLGILEEYVARDKASKDDDVLGECDDENDISPEDRLMAAAGMKNLVADMRAAGAKTVGEFFAMQQEAANKANADGAL